MDRGHYAAHTLRLPRHPFENNERLMARVLVFALLAHERLEFGGGLAARPSRLALRGNDKAFRAPSSAGADSSATA